MEQHTPVLQQDILQQSHMLQTCSKRAVTQQTLLYLHLVAAVHASSSNVISWPAQKLFDHNLYLMDNSDIIATRAMSLRTRHKIRKASTVQIYHFRWNCVNQNATRKRCWKSFGGLRLPISKGGHLTVCHAMTQKQYVRTIIINVRESDSEYEQNTELMLKNLYCVKKCCNNLQLHQNFPPSWTSLYTRLELWAEGSLAKPITNVCVTRSQC
jgi:hypothetical protein